MSSNWQHQLEKIAERAKNILHTGLWADCTFIVGMGDNCKEFKAHKLILSMSSAVFDAMFNGSMREEDPDKIKVVDIQPEAFASFLKYIYSDEIEIQSFDKACELCYVAKKYMLPNLVQHCITYIWKDINPTNACRAYEFAKLFDQLEITEDCKKIIMSQTSEVIEHPSFKDVEKDTLLMILGQDDLNIKSEKQLFEAVENWVEAEFERKGVTDDAEKLALYYEIICNIRFLSMSAQDFAEGPAVSPYLKKEDSYAILMNLVSRTSPVRLPENFSDTTRTMLGCEEESCKLRSEVCWQLKYPAKMEVLPKTDYALYISCNKDIQVFGIKVLGNVGSSLIEPHKESDLSNSGWIGERMTAFIENIYSTSVERVVKKMPTVYEEYFYFMFSRPYTMVANKFYVIGVKSNYSGTCTAGLFDYDSLMFKSLKFDFAKSGIDQLSCICGILCKTKQ